MANFHFPQYKQELFYCYWECLNAYLAQCAHYGYSYGNWEILGIVNEGVNCEIHTLLECWDFHSKNVDEAQDMLEWFIGDTYKFK